jgi:UDP-glucuronate decarboxylase
MKILVSGGAGFLGSNLCKKLLEEGNEVIAVDNLLTGSLENLTDLNQNPHFKFLNRDITEDLSDIEKVDQIYHLASPASPNKNSQKSYHALPFETMKVNTTGTWKLLDKAVLDNAKFLFASTSETYGDPLEHPQKETYRGNVSTTGPRSIYDEAKRFGETIVAAFVRTKEVDGRIIRIFNTYGPRMNPDDGRVVIEFIKHALKNEPLPIFGNGKQTRSFCYVDDLIEGITKAMNIEGTTGEIYNLGNPEEYTILELAEIVKKITNSTSEVKIMGDLPEDDPLKRKPDISKAKNKLGWQPKVSIEEGLKKFIEYLGSQS